MKKVKQKEPVKNSGPVTSTGPSKDHGPLYSLFHVASVGRLEMPEIVTSEVIARISRHRVPDICSRRIVNAIVYAREHRGVANIKPQ